MRLAVCSLAFVAATAAADPSAPEWIYVSTDVKVEGGVVTPLASDVVFETHGREALAPLLGVSDANGSIDGMAVDTSVADELVLYLSADKGYTTRGRADVLRCLANGGCSTVFDASANGLGAGMDTRAVGRFPNGDLALAFSASFVPAAGPPTVVRPVTVLRWSSGNGLRPERDLQLSCLSVRHSIDALGPVDDTLKISTDVGGRTTGAGANVTFGRSQVFELDPSTGDWSRRPAFDFSAFALADIDAFASVDSGILRFASATASVSEDAGALDIGVERVEGNEAPVDVRVRSSDGNAVAGQDFAQVDEQVAFADGAAGTKTVSVDILDNGAVDGDRQFTLEMQHADSRWTLFDGPPPTLTVTIQDDDTRQPTALDRIRLSSSADVAIGSDTLGPGGVLEDDLGGGHRVEDLGLPSGADVDAYQEVGAAKLFSLAADATLAGGLQLTDADVAVRLDGEIRLVLDGSEAGIPDGVGVDAVSLSPGSKLTMSLDSSANLPGINGQVSANDIIVLDGQEFDSPFTLPGDIDALHIAERPSTTKGVAGQGFALLASFAGAGSIGGVSYGAEDVLEIKFGASKDAEGGLWDRKGGGVSALLAYDASQAFSGLASTNVDALGADMGFEDFELDPSFSGTWLDITHNGEGWLIQFPQPNQAVVYWFTYPSSGAPGKQAWLFDIKQPQGNTLNLTDGRRPQGTRFGDGFDPDQVQFPSWGDFAFEFASCNSGSLVYAGPSDFGAGVLDADRLSRVDGLSGMQCTGGSSRRAATGDDAKGAGGSGNPPGLSGTWFQPSNNGEGWLIQEFQGQMAVYWFTYPPEGSAGSQTWLLGTGTLDSSNTLTMPMTSIPQGTVFGEGFNPGDVSFDDWGELEIEFTGCDSAVVRYDSDVSGFGSGEFANVERLTPVAGQSCSL